MMGSLVGHCKFEIPGDFCCASGVEFRDCRASGITLGRLQVLEFRYN